VKSHVACLGFAAMIGTALIPCCTRQSLLPSGIISEEKAASCQTDPRRTGSSTEVLEPPLEKVWSVRLTAAPASRFCANGGVLLAPSQDGRIAFIRIFDGKTLRTIKVLDRVESSCVVQDGLLITALRWGKHSIIARRLQDGKLIWTADVGPVESELALGDGFFMVGTGRAEAALIDVRTGKILWRRNLGHPVCGCAAVSPDSLLFATEGGRLACLSSNGGVVRWSAMLPAGLSADPVIAGGLVLIGTQDGRFFALDQRSGQEVWHFKAEGGIHLGAASDGLTVFFGTSRGWLYALACGTGKELWRFRARGAIGTSPILSGESVYIGSMDKFLYAVDRKTGKGVWETAFKGRVRSTLLIHGGMLLAGSEEGAVFGFRRDSDVGK